MFELVSERGSAIFGGIRVQRSARAVQYMQFSVDRCVSVSVIFSRESVMASESPNELRPSAVRPSGGTSVRHAFARGVECSASSTQL